jgi:uncharacterized membrane protein
MPRQRPRWRLPRSDQAGVFAAAAASAMTFQRTLMPRNTTDQAIITGSTMALAYLMASIAHDITESSASWLLVGGRTDKADDDLLRRVSLAADVAGLSTGLALQAGFPQRPNEPFKNAATRALGFSMAVGSFAGLAAGMTEETLDWMHEKTGRRFHLDKFPVALTGGIAFAAIREFQRRRKEAPYRGAPPDDVSISGIRALGMGAGIGVGLLALLTASRASSRLLGRTLDRVLPGDERLWGPLGHVLSLGVLLGALYAQWYRISHKIEEGTSKIEGASTRPPESTLVSAGPGSEVDWETLGREGRRHVFTVLRKPWIEEVMGEPATDPIRVFVGLDSAPTEEERISLALRELERTGAFDRSLIIAASPTGTGYVNYVAVESAEYFTRGNCATVTVQYSKRPSPVSLDRVWEGRKQFRMLLAGIRRRLYTMAPGGRPKLVVFGESLGAHTSQDAFLHAGTQGLQDAGIDRALWIGTPHLSKWKAQVKRGERPDVDLSLIGEFDNFREVEALDLDTRSRLRYFLVTHGNDGVGHFGPDLLIQRPDWLGDPESRPPGVPPSQKWIIPTTFFQTLIDMKNAMNVVPGEFDASGHDYRADLARFVREAWDLQCSDEQLERVEVALRRYELLRQGWMEAHSAPVAASPNGQDAG